MLLIIVYFLKEHIIKTGQYIVIEYVKCFLTYKIYFS